MTNELQGRAAQIAALRERAEADMLRIGVDAAFIDLLVETFYQRIQVHPRLGPVFDARLAGRWPQHMEKMKRFWSSIALKTGAYGGKPVQAHKGVEGLVPELFPEWLGLFAATLHDIAPTLAATTKAVPSICRSVIGCASTRKPASAPSAGSRLIRMPKDDVGMRRNATISSA